MIEPPLAKIFLDMPRSLSPPLGCIVSLGCLETEIPASEHLPRFDPAAVVVALPLWNGTKLGGGSTRLLLFNGELGERGRWCDTRGQLELPACLECPFSPSWLLLPSESIESESLCPHIQSL